ncbi:MAG: ABC transporter ATP-binding protein [Planctomycetota bacterium]
MDAFWAFARDMLRYRVTVAWAVVFAAISAASLGTGLVAIAPILDTILNSASGEARGLDAIASEAAAGIGWLTIPASWFEVLPSSPYHSVLLLVGFVALLTLFGAVANFMHQFMSLSVVFRTMTNIRRRAFTAVVRMPLAAIGHDARTAGSGDTVSRIVNDTGALGGGLSALLSKALAQITKGAAAFVAAVIIEWRLTLVAIPVALLLNVVIRKIGKRIRRASRAALRSQGELYSASTEVLQGLRVVKTSTTERRETARFQRINRQVMREMLRARTARALSSPLLELISIFAVGGLAVIAAKAILDGDLQADRFVAALMSLGVAGASLRPMAGLINEIQASSAAAGRLKELFAAEPEPGHDRALPRLPRHERSLVFDRITFAYPGSERPALRDVTLQIARGERIAVVGPNGSGKTTLLSLVPRLFDPAQGSVLIDGHDIRDYSVRSLRRQIGVVTQETVLFAGTIASNITYGTRGASMAAVRDAAERARADGFIAELDVGYDALVGERGLTLSGGQRQRLAIARAMLRDPAILILDEATSMIDADSEAKIAEALAELSHGRTTLTVAHRLSTVIDADRIVVMDRARIADIGTHDELLGRCEVYRQLAQHQLAGARSGDS